MSDWLKRKVYNVYVCSKCGWNHGKTAPKQCVACGANNQNSDNQWWRIESENTYE